MIKQLQSREGDIGSTPVQSELFNSITIVVMMVVCNFIVGIMTVRIKALQAHNKIHPKVTIQYQC